MTALTTVSLTRAEYIGITPDPNTLYIVSDGPVQTAYLGATVLTAGELAAAKTQSLLQLAQASQAGAASSAATAHADKDYVARQSAAKRAMWSDEGFRASYRESIAHRCSSIRCTETGEVFPSIRDAARFAGCNPGTLCRELKTGAKVRGEYTFTKEGR